jgi:transcriptional regulator with XRE-family HTH domain
MRVSSARDLGLFVRDERHRRKLSQAELSDAAHVSRRWLSGFEAGKPSAEVGLVFRVLHALDLMLEAGPMDESEIDLDDVIRAHGYVKP